MAEFIQGLNIGLQLDTTGISSGLKDLKRQLKNVDSEMKANMSAFDRGEKSVEKYQTQLTGLNKKLDAQKAATNEARRQYERLADQHGANSRQAQDAAREFNNQAGNLNNLQRVVDDTRRAFEEFQREQEIAESTFGRLGTALDEAGGKFTKFGDGMQKVGGSMSKTITAPILGLGAGMIATAISAEESSVRIQNTLGLTAEEAQKLKEVSQGLYKDGFGESLEEVDTALLQTKQNMKDLSDTDLAEATKSALILAQTFDADVNEVTRAGNNLMKGFGIESGEAFDLMAHGAQNGLNFSNEMFDNLSEYSTLFGNMGFSAEEYFELLQKGSEAGVYNLDYINDVMKEFQIRVKDGSKASTDAMAGLSKETNDVWKAFLKGDGTVKDVSNTVLAELSGMDDQVKANEIGVGLYGTKWEDLEADAMYALGGVGEGLEGVSGSVDEMAKNMEESFGQRMTGIWRETKAAMVPFGEVLLNLAEGVLPKVSAGIETVSGWLKDMSPSMQNNVVMFAGLAAAAGPLIAGLGFVASGIGGIMTVAAPLATAIAGAGGLSASIGIAGTAIATFATGPVGIAIAAVAGIGIATGLLVKHFREDAIPEVDRFGEGVSESTQKALGSFFELSDGASQSLMDMRINGTEVTELMADELLVKYEDMNDQILNSMEARYKEENTQLKTFFENSSVLTEEEEAKAFDLKVSRQEAAMKVQQSHEDEIQRIVETAATEKRELTESELLQIDTLHQQMNESAVVYLSENEMEQKVIMERMAATSGELSAQQAAAVVKSSAESRDKVIGDANTKYDETVAMAIRERDETGTITTEQADKIIAEATKAKDTAVLRAEEMHTGVVDEAKLQAEGHVEQVDWQTGEILSKWDVYKAGVIQRFHDTNTESIEDFKTFGTRFDEEWTIFNDKAQIKVDAWKANVKRRFTETNNESLADFKRWGTNFDEGWTNFNDKAKEKVATYKSNVKQRFNETNSESLGDFKRWGTNFNDGWNSFNTNAKAKVDDYKAGVKKRFRETNADSLADFKRWGGNIKDWASDAKDSIMKTFDNLVSGAKNLPGRIGSGISSMASKVSDGVKKVSNKLAGGLGTGVNGVIGGINWVLGKIGVDSKVPKWDVPEYAHGTHGHKGGLALVGDGKGSNAGRELIKTPSGELGLSPATNTLLNLPKGTEVLSARKTRELLGDVPKYANGIGGFLNDMWQGTKNLGSKAWEGTKNLGSKVKDTAFNVWDHVSNPSKLLSTALSMLGVSAPAGGSFVGNMAKGGYNKVKDGAVGYLKGKIDSSGTQAGSGHGFGSKFRLTSRRGFRINPVTGIGQMHQGDDWGAPAGTLIPAQAAGKVIQSGFHSIRGNYVRVQSGIMDRLYQHNTRNMVQVGQNVRKGQAVGTVGSTGRSTGPHLHYEVRKNGVNVNPNGLETGGLIQSEQYVKVGEKNRDEIMIPLHPSRRTDAMKLLAIAGKRIMGDSSDKGITRPNQLPNVGGGGNAMDAILAATVKTNEFLMKQNELLMQLLNKDANVYMNEDSLVGSIGKSMDNHLGNSSSRNGYFEGLR